MAIHIWLFHIILQVFFPFYCNPLNGFYPIPSKPTHRLFCGNYIIIIIGLFIYSSSISIFIDLSIYLLTLPNIAFPNQTYFEWQNNKLMRFGLPNRIDVVEWNLKSEFDRRITVDSDSNDLIESMITISI